MSERLVVDTDVISILIKSHSLAEEYRAILSGKQIVVSFMTVAELKKWALKRKWGANRIARLDQQLKNFVMYNVDLDLCQRWAEVMTAAESLGRPMSPQDAWIAATALQMRLPLVTNNTRDFDVLPELTIVTAK